MPAPSSRNGHLCGIRNEEDSETLRKTLTHVDLDSGLRNRTLNRDPITGLGLVAAGPSTGKSKPRAQSVGRRGYNVKLISWDADAPAPENASATPRRRKDPTRNPISMTGEFGDEVDQLRTTNRPRWNATPREPRRDPISGKGDFGDREWDPIWKYNGRMRRSKSSNTLRTDPLTGHNVKSYAIRAGEKTQSGGLSTKQNGPVKNTITGEHCSTFTVKPGMKANPKEHCRSPGRNAITGENCDSFDINSEMSTTRKRSSSKASNPVNGENVSNFVFSQEERNRQPKPYVYKNTLTGENVPSYQINPLEKNVTPRSIKSIQNPLNGENMNSYVYRAGEKKLQSKKIDISSPLTGEGSRGRTYTVSTEERGSNGKASHQQLPRARSQGSLRNVLTGENCETYLVYKEMRSEKMAPKTHSTTIMRNIIVGI